MSRVAGWLGRAAWWLYRHSRLARRAGNWAARWALARALDRALALSAEREAGDAEDIRAELANPELQRDGEIARQELAEGKGRSQAEFKVFMAGLKEGKK